MPPTELRRRDIPDATVARLSAYLHVLEAMADRGEESTSSEALATAAGVQSAKVRKDLSYLGTCGVRGVGYDVGRLAVHIARELGLAKDWPVVIVGMGNLGRALAGSGTAREELGRQNVVIGPWGGGGNRGLLWH